MNTRRLGKDILRGRWPTWLVAVFLLCAGLLVYANVLRYPFVHDDVVFIQQNPHIGRWDNIGEAFLGPGIAFPSAGITTPYYRPVLEVFYRLEYLLFGFRPAGFHFVNILIHILNAFLVYLVALSWRFRRSWAFVLAIIFLIHPVQSEAVACISGISNLVVTFFLLISFLCYAEARRSKRAEPRWYGLIGALMFFLFALLTKEQAVVFPALVGLYEYVLAGKRRQEWAAALGGVAALILMASGYLLWRAHLFPGSLGAAFENLAELRLRLLAIPGTILMDAGIILWPVGLHYYRSVDILAPMAGPVFVFLGLAIAMAAMLLKMPSRHRTLVLWGLGWFFITLAPMLNIAPLINEYSLVLAAEHFLYFPVIGFLVFGMAVAAWALGGFWRDLNKAVKIIFVGGLVILLATATVRQNTFWRGEIPLFERTLQFEPGLGRVHLLLGKAYAVQGHFPEALACYTTGLKIMEDYVKKSGHSQARGVYAQYVKSAHFDRGQAWMFLGQWEWSNEDYRAALALRLGGGAPANGELSDSMIANNMGLNHIRLGWSEEARRYFQLAVALDPANAQALNNLGMSYFERGDRALAGLFFHRALKMAPGFSAAAANLNRVSGRL